MTRTKRITNRGATPNLRRPGGLRWVRALGGVALGVSAALAACWPATAAAELTPELYFKVKAAKIAKSIPLKGTSGPSILYWKLAGNNVEILCHEDQDLAYLQVHGLTLGATVIENCGWVSPPTPAAITEECTIPSVDTSFQDALVYKKASSQILDLFQPPSGSTTFTVLKIEGASCVVSGNQPLKGKALATISPERGEAKTGKVKFEVAANHEEQVPSEYTETEGGPTGTKASLTLAGEPAAFSSEATLELLSGEEWGAF